MTWIEGSSMSPGASKETVLSQMGQWIEALVSAASAASAAVLFAATVIRASQTLH